MTVEFNHTIVWSRDSGASATFLAQILGLPEPNRWGPFQVVATGNGVNVDFMDKGGEIPPQHYAFLVSEAEFDQILGRVKNQGLSYWADPGRTMERQINTQRRGHGLLDQENIAFHSFEGGFMDGTIFYTGHPVRHRHHDTGAEKPNRSADFCDQVL